MVTWEILAQALGCESRGFCITNVLDGLGLEESILDGLDDWPRSATRKECFRLTRELVARTIADLDLPPNEVALVEEAFIGAGLL